VIPAPYVLTYPQKQRLHRVFHESATRLQPELPEHRSTGQSEETPARAGCQSSRTRAHISQFSILDGRHNDIIAVNRKARSIFFQADIDRFEIFTPASRIRSAEFGIQGDTNKRAGLN
jgi:hypothetical protein